jgi:hypothetical protein
MRAPARLTLFLLFVGDTPLHARLQLGVALAPHVNSPDTWNTSSEHMVHSEIRIRVSMPSRQHNVLISKTAT